MYVFKEIDKSSTVIESNIVNYTQDLTTASLGIQSIKIVSGSRKSISLFFIIKAWGQKMILKRIPKSMLV